MSKDQKKNIEMPVETVENLIRLLDYITSTIEFWKIENIFPMNLILDCCKEVQKEISTNYLYGRNYKGNPRKSVSRSHINDK